jgi:small subunit ribosomal protein S20
MPILKHAKKKLKQDKNRTIRNKKIKDTFKKLLKTAKADKAADSVSKAVSAVDKATKKHILSPNKAARIKSSLAKHVASDAPVAAAPKKTTAKSKAKAKASKSSGAKKAKPASKK